MCWDLKEVTVETLTHLGGPDSESTPRSPLALSLHWGIAQQSSVAGSGVECRYKRGKKSSQIYAGVRPGSALKVKPERINLKINRRLMQKAYNQVYRTVGAKCIRVYIYCIKCIQCSKMFPVDTQTKTQLSLTTSSFLQTTFPISPVMFSIVLF